MEKIGWKRYRARKVKGKNTRRVEVKVYPVEMITAEQVNNAEFNLRENKYKTLIDNWGDKKYEDGGEINHIVKIIEFAGRYIELHNVYGKKNEEYFFYIAAEKRKKAKIYSALLRSNADVTKIKIAKIELMKISPTNCIDILKTRLREICSINNVEGTLKKTKNTLKPLLLCTIQKTLSKNIKTFTKKLKFNNLPFKLFQ